MRNDSETQFYSKFVLLLILLEINTTVFSSFGINPCKIINNTGCVIQCSNYELHSEINVRGLTEILQTKKQKFNACTLIIKSCTFTNQTITPRNEITVDWPKIDNLKLLNCLIDFNDFSSKILTNVRELTVENTTTVSLQSKVFRQLPKLEKLRLNKNNLLKWVEKGFLQNLSLAYLQIQGVNLTPPETFQFFKNLTGGCQIQSIQEIDWSHNNLNYFKKDLLTFFPNLKILNLTDSNISNFEEESFNKRIKRLYLNNNKIKTLEEKIFRPLIEKTTFVSFEGNPLMCDCGMKWLQNLEKKHAFQINCTFSEVCQEKSDDITINCTPKESLEILTDYNSWLNATKPKEIHKKFFIKNEKPKFLEITITDKTNLERAFLWYGNYGNTTSPQFSCMKILKRKFSIYVMPDVNYLVCLAMNYKYFQIDIFDCLPVKTKPLHPNQPWLTKKSIPLSIISIFVLFLFALTTGALILYLSIRKNPTLIRGSKRVIEVKRHDKAQLLIMPRGYENVRQTEGSSVALMNPPLPLEPSMSSDTISTVSYVSANQPTQLEILTYRLSRLRELFQRNNNLPSGVSSLPMQIATPINQRLPPNVDLLFEYEWYTITTTTEMK